MKQANYELRDQIRKNHLTHWMVADELGVSEITFSRWLRHELTGEKKEAVMNAIKTCKRNNEEGNE